MLAFLSKPLPEEVDPIRAGEENPVIRPQSIDGPVKFFPTKGRDNFNGGEFNHLSPESFKVDRKFTRLLPGSRD
jgi:hypothetical protein